MKAKVQYNDFTGTAAADISDLWINSIDEYLANASPHYNRDEYSCIGCELYVAGDNGLDIIFYCRHVKHGEIVPIRLNRDVNTSELCNIFKRLSIVIGNNIEDIAEPEIETIYLDC